jgi:hypothetical protein
MFFRDGRLAQMVIASALQLELAYRSGLVTARNQIPKK